MGNIQGWQVMASVGGAIAAVVAAVFAWLTWIQGSKKPVLQPRFSVQGANLSTLELTAEKSGTRVEIIAFNKGSRAAKYPRITLFFPRNPHIIGAVEGSYLRLYEEIMPRAGEVMQVEWNPMHNEVVHAKSALSMGYLSFQLPENFRGKLPIPYRANAEEMNTGKGEIRIVAK